MKSFYRRDGKLECMAGSRISDAIEEAIQISGEEGSPVTFDFNEVIVTVEKTSVPALIHRDWERAMRGSIGKNVGPFPAASLTPEEAEHDAAIERSKEARRSESIRRYAEEARRKADHLKSILAGAPPLDISAPGIWEEGIAKNQDPYGSAVYRYAEAWGRLMQVEIAAGKLLAEIADATSHQADSEGITGFMYGASVSILAACWKHGEELRRWHNLKTQIRNEGERANETGGVLNPAVLTIGGEG